MNWLNIELKSLRSEEYLGSTPEQRATWLNLTAFCADHENGGVIKECATWGNRKWMQLVGVSKGEIESECDLWEFDEYSIKVAFYPAEQEQKVRRNRNNGKKGGRPTGKTTNDTSGDKPCGLPHAPPSGSVSLKRNSNSNSNSKGNSNSNSKEALGKPVHVSEQFNALQDGDVKDALKLYMEYRAEQKKRFTSTTFALFVDTLRREYAGKSENAFVNDVTECLTKGWKNFVFPSQRKK